MFDQSRLQKVLAQYKKDFVPKHWDEEKYKWEAVKCFQDNWDIKAANFKDMLSRSLSKTNNLLSSLNNFPAGMILGFAETAPEDVRSMYTDLFDESKDVFERIEHFKMQASILLEKYGNGAKQHYQYENAITTYLWLRYPDKYYIFKFSEVKAVADELQSSYVFKKGAYVENLRNFYALYNEICGELKKDTELVKLFRSQLAEPYYPDPELKTLTVDVGFYISHGFLQQKKVTNEGEIPKDPETGKGAGAAGGKEPTEQGYWWLTANPKIWSFSETRVGEVQNYTLYNENGNKRRIFQNFLDARAGDLVIGYESNPVKQIVALVKVSAANDGQKIAFEKTESLANPIDYQALKECLELKDMEFFKNSNGSFFKLTKEEFEFLMDMIREVNPLPSVIKNPSYTKQDFLSEVYMPEEKYDSLTGVLRNKMNIILQGAPGVGKTFAAKRLAYSLMGEKDDSRVELIQFHQNYSYEDFMMGYKPSGNSFELQSGVFFKFCKKAENQPGESE